MILVALGSNLPSAAGDPLATCQAALKALAERGIETLSHSHWYETAPIPASDQPWFVNGVATMSTTLDPQALLQRLHAIEHEFARTRSIPNAARTLDLDLLSYEEKQIANSMLTLPHPRLHERSFVLYPLRDVAPTWRHPLLGLTPDEMISKLPSGSEKPRIRLVLSPP